MKLSLITLFFFMLCSSAFAERFSSTIHSIDLGKSKEFHLVRFDNGRVSFLNPKDNLLRDALIYSNERGETVEVQVDKDHVLIAAQTISTEDLEMDEEAESWSEDRQEYAPTIVKNYTAAQKIFQRMRRDFRKQGECYNRAHVWSYEEYKRSRLNSMKIFMFFTERYIRRYNYHWWFHVTPMVYVTSINSPRTLDRRYTTAPRYTKTWSDVFIKSKRRCKIVKRFDDFWLNQQTQDCYHIYSSMYYVIPRDLEKRDLSGKEKTEFVPRELQIAYKDGFGRNVTISE